MTPSSAAGTRATTSITALPLASVPSAHSTAPAQLPCEGVADISSTPAGNASLTRTPVAVDGQAFDAVRVQVTVRPAATVAGPVLAIAKSVAGPTAVDAEAESLLGSSSPWSPATVAVLSTVVSASATGTWTVTCRVVAAPLTGADGAGHDAGRRRAARVRRDEDRPRRERVGDRDAEWRRSAHDW